MPSLCGDKFQDNARSRQLVVRGKAEPLQTQTAPGSIRPHTPWPGALLAAAVISDCTCSDTAVYYKIKKKNQLPRCTQLLNPEFKCNDSTETVHEKNNYCYLHPSYLTHNNLSALTLQNDSSFLPYLILYLQYYIRGYTWILLGKSTSIVIKITSFLK